MAVCWALISFGIHIGVRETYKSAFDDGYKDGTKDTQEPTEIISPAKNEISTQNPFIPPERAEKYRTAAKKRIPAHYILFIHFNEDELHTIANAAIRNDCSGEDFLILLAIRKSEGGGKGKEFGIKNPKAWNTNLDTQAGWAAATVVKNRQRWIDAGKPKPFIEFLGDKYCPPDIHTLNENWVGNVTFWYNKLKLPDE